jgi:NADPH:quinone reductase-like Zn-dependent oxidoreductase/acyl carrier protein
VAFLTAYYSLVHLAGLRRGERVLIHGGAGGVGLAAVQVARHLGASVIVTAGAEEKRALLRDLGADAVFNSRALTFADEVLQFTAGAGVDVVLNSLPGEAMVRSIECLHPFGRFIELGKRDFYANTHIGLRPLRRNLTYFGVDVDQLITGHRELTQRLFKELMELLATGELKPLPYRAFDGQSVADAFRLMERAGHIGKIVVAPAARPTARMRAGHFPIDVTGIHVIVGGTSGFGLATAEWLVARGARHIALASRSGAPSGAAKSQIEALRNRGANVTVVALDVGQAESVDTALAALGAGRRIAGIVQAAMVLDDHLIENLDAASIQNVFRPKVDGALNIERAARRLRLDYLLFYSSATTLLGNPGQYNYVAANAFVEGVALRASRQGMPAIAVSWGGIEDAGYLARNIGTNISLKKRFATSLLQARSALDALDLAFDEAGKPCVASLAIAQIDWAMVKRELPIARTSIFADIIAAPAARQSSDGSITLEKLRSMSPPAATAALLDMIVEEIARVLRLSPKEVDRDRALTDIGMDSLMLLELRATVEKELDLELPMMSLAAGITPADVARRAASLILGSAANQEVLPGNMTALAASHIASESDTTETGRKLAAARAVLDRSRNMTGPI